MPIITPAPRKISWGALRRGIKEVIIAAAPGARVHNRWGLKYDLLSTIGRLKAESGPYDLHAWMIKIRDVDPAHIKIGGGETLYPLIIDVWGFQSFEYGNDQSNSQDDFEDEVDDVIAYLDANRGPMNVFGLPSDQHKYFRDIQLGNWNLDIASFGQGYDVHVCKGEITGKIVRIK